MLVGLARHDQALLYLSLLLRLLVLSIVLGPEETTCTTRTNPDYTWREIIESILIQSIHSAHGRRSEVLIDLDTFSRLLHCA